MKIFQRHNYLLLVLLLIITFFVGTKFGQNRANQAGVSSIFSPTQNTQLSVLPSAVDTKLINEVWNILHKKYVGTVKDDELANGMIRGMVSGLGDPYSTFADRIETSQFEQDLSGNFSGIGVEIGKKNGLITIIAPLKDYPAYKAGVKAGDIIYRIDGKDLPNDASLGEVASQIRGTIGTDVKLGILREKADGPLEITVRRENIELPSVTMDVKDDIAVINLSIFHEDTANKFKTLVKQILNQHIKGIVLDMRNNPGGVLQGAVEIAGHFYKDGIVVKEVPSDPAKTIIHYSEGPGDLEKIPVVVLVNGGSASASEILAGALRDARGIKIIGEKTFGKGSVQELVNLNDGSSLRITIAKWFMPKGGEIAEKGIEPDIVVENQDNNDKVDVQLDRAIAVLKTEMAGK
jgi:carboxyl-terminal processing protease